MSKKSYNQYCGIAQALDLVGERWTLLIVRQLMEGPQRFSDLQDGLPGIATDILSNRLKSLEEHGFIRRTSLPAPGPSRVYELTDTGRTLRPLLGELARFGLQHIGKQGERHFSSSYLYSAILSLYNNDQANFSKPVVVRWRTPGATLDVRFGPDGLQRLHDDTVTPDLIISGTATALVRSLQSDGDSARGLIINGPGSLMRRVLRVFQ